MDLENESLLALFLEDEEEVKKLVEWNKANDHERSDIFECRLEEADKLREEGNGHFKKGDYEVALYRYFAAIWHIDFDVGQQWNMMDHHQKDLNERKLKVISNVCAVYLKQKSWLDTKKAADIGLRHLKKAELTDSDAEAKFYYRKGLANLERGFNEEAFEELKKADKLTPGDRQIRQALSQAGESSKADQQKAKEVWKSRFLTQEEKALREASRGSPWHPKVLYARWRMWLREEGFRKCCRRKLS
eukprot:TRINITY_DN77373_c0_g1_i1.p1 TRINITY_DN77373_c0_g1~~TRINITY_DN77373_c0_g1_i1.p1  ORF type:complete len:246 (-),score=85.48 TRINITY_DN77373_c0_g1_i1:131-868(-)